MRAAAMRGKAALVTGVSGELGRATARKLAEAGAGLCIVDEDRGALDVLAAELVRAGADTLAFAADLGEVEQCRAAVAAAVDRFGGLDALCNMANAFFPAHAATMAAGDWDRTFAINLRAPFFLFQAALPQLIERGGAVVFVSSCAAFMAEPMTAAYTASKAGMVQMTKALAKEYMDQTIRINCVAPGSMAIGSGSQTRVPDDIDTAELQRLAPGRGLVEVDRFADVVAFLASDAATGFHGSCLPMDNGISLG